MGGFGNFAEDIGTGLSYLLPMMCYCTGGCLMLVSIYGFVQVSKGEGKFAARPWLPLVTLLIAATLLSFETLLSAASASFGFNTSVTLGGDPTQAPSASVDALVGASPEEMLVNILLVFGLYFEIVGALIVFMAVLRLKSHLEGSSRSSVSYCLIKAGAGVLVMNAEQVVPLLMQPFNT